MALHCRYCFAAIHDSDVAHKVMQAYCRHCDRQFKYTFADKFKPVQSRQTGACTPDPLEIVETNQGFELTLPYRQPRHFLPYIASFAGGVVGAVFFWMDYQSSDWDPIWIVLSVLGMSYGVWGFFREVLDGIFRWSAALHIRLEDGVVTIFDEEDAKRESVVLNIDDIRGLLVLKCDQSSGNSNHVLSLVDKDGGRHMIPWLIRNADQLAYLQRHFTVQYEVAAWQLQGFANEDEVKAIGKRAWN